LTKLGLKPEEVVYIGDQASGDVIAPKVLKGKVRLG
jgi:predicted HAD superfamily phosphohydrolase YqeG